VATDDSGHIAVHFPRDNFSRPALTMKVALSAWGIATHSSKRLLAISCNALYVTVFHLGMGIEGWDWTRPADGMGEGIPNIELRGPKQNIPCVAFERSGNYVASGDLDGSIHLWACRTGQKVQQIRCQGPYVLGFCC
jgi:WD40 repeat protein